MMKKQSVFYSLLITYLLVLIIPVFIGGVAYILVGSVVEKEINEANASLIKHVRDLVDSRLRDVEQLSVQIALSGRINSAITSDRRFEELDSFSYYKIIEEMKSFGVNKYYISDYYVYLKNTEVILSQYSRFDAKQYFDYYWNKLTISYEEWIEILKNNHRREFILLGVNNKTGEEHETLVYMQSLPISDPQELSATTVIEIDGNKLKNSLKNIDWVNNGQVLILDESDRVISSVGINNYSPLIKYENLHGESGLNYEDINGQKMAISFITSSLIKWKYVSIIPYKVFWEKVNYIRNLIIACLSVSVIVGGAMIFFFSKRNYNPIKAVIKELVQKSDDVYDSRVNELDFIKTIVSTTLDQNNDLLERIQKQQNMLKDNFLLRLIQGRLDTEIPLQDMLAEYDIQFYSDYFALMLFCIEDYTGLFDNGKEQIPGKQNNLHNLVKLIIRNDMEEICNREHSGFVIEVDDRIMACIINFNSKNKNLYDCAIKLAEEGRRFFTTNHKIYCTISISDIHTGAGAFTEAYREAVHAMEYKIVVGKNAIIEYRNIKDRLSNCYYNIEIEQKLVNFIKIGDHNRVREVIHQVFQRYISENSVSVDVVKCLMYDLTSTLAKTIDSICEPSFIEQINPIKRLLSCETAFDMETELLSITKEICENRREKKRYNQLGVEVMKYIDNKYNDINLGVGMLGNEFDMAPSYLSKLFREQMGISIPDYINKVRISKAKEMLESGSFSLADIALKIGFVNSNALIRIFKKYECITPGQFKNIASFE
jgi:two-component system response regulator YesN